jgi:hypothetical protein
MECYRIIRWDSGGDDGGVVSSGFPISGVRDSDSDVRGSDCGVIAGVKYGDKYDE